MKTLLLILAAISFLIAANCFMFVQLAKAKWKPEDRK